MRMTAEQRFKRGLGRRNRNGCVLWKRAKVTNGYGVIGINGKQVMTHRYAWERVNGPIPAGLCVLHSCDTPACCAPEHLRVGTHADNTADKMARGRQASGERNGKSKLTDRQVARIREMLTWEPITYKIIAAAHGVSQVTISRINSGDRRPRPGWVPVVTGWERVLDAGVVAQMREG